MIRRVHLPSLYIPGEGSQRFLDLGYLTLPKIDWYVAGACTRQEKSRPKAEDYKANSLSAFALPNNSSRIWTGGFRTVTNAVFKVNGFSRRRKIRVDILVFR